MPLTDYTTYEAVRTVSGLSSVELSDAQLAQDIFLTMLQADLGAISVQLDPLYLSLLGPDPLTPEESHFVKAVKVFSPYAVARSAMSSSGMSGLKKIEDGKARAERFSDALSQGQNGVQAQYAKWRQHLVDAFEGLGYVATTSATRVWMQGVTPIYNPVTGEGV